MDIGYKVAGMGIKCKNPAVYSRISLGTRNYLRLVFSFSPEWDEFKKIVVFNGDERTEEAVELDKDDACYLPEKFCDMKEFTIYAYGAKGTQVITTRKELIRIGG